MSHDSLVQEITDRGERLLRRYDELKRLLALVQNLGSSVSEAWESSARDARGLAIVCSAAELESLTKFLIQQTHRNLNSTIIVTREMRPSIRQVAAHSTFESLRHLQDHSKLWEKRAYATTLDSCLDSVSLPIETKGPQPPLDGKTLRPEHFNRIWEIYGLPGVSFPHSPWALSLQKISSIRNDIAHANLPFDEIFKQPGVSISDIELYIDHLGEFAIHLTSSLIDYLRLRLYLDKPSSSGEQHQSA